MTLATRVDLTVGSGVGEPHSSLSFCPTAQPEEWCPRRGGPRSHPLGWQLSWVSLRDSGRPAMGWRWGVVLQENWGHWEGSLFSLASLLSSTPFVHSLPSGGEAFLPLPQEPEPHCPAFPLKEAPQNLSPACYEVCSQIQGQAVGGHRAGFACREPKGCRGPIGLQFGTG